MKKNASLLMPCLLAAALVLAGCATRTPAPVVGSDGQPVVLPTPAAKDTYTVKSGDTLYSIAREHGMDHRELIAMNGIENPNYITVGRVLKIKPKGAATQPPGEVVVAQPITVAPVVEQRPLSGGSAEAASGVNTELLKREPLAGKVPYSDQALAQAQHPEAGKGGAVVAPPAPEQKPAEPAAPVAEARTGVWPVSGKVIGTYGENGNKGLDVAGKSGDPVLAAEEGKVILANNTLRGYGNMIVVKHSATLISVYAHNSKMLVKEGQNVTKGQKIAEMGNTDADQVKLHFEVRLQGKPVDPLKYLPPR